MDETGPHAGGGCCSPSRGTANGARATTVEVTGNSPASTSGMVALSGGVFELGAENPWAYPDDGETPREVEVSPS